MSERTETLARSLEEGAAALANFANTLTDEEWHTRTPKDGRKVGVIVNHVASVYPLEIEFAQSVAAGKPADIQKTQREAVSAIDTAVKKEIIHRNKAARQKSAMSAKAKAAGAKVVKGEAKKSAPAPRKTAKTTPKKPAAKKATSKK